MVEFRAYDIFKEDEKYDNCGNLTIACLKIDKITIPLCEECVLDLIMSVKAFDETTFCNKCIHWIPNEYGWSYDGSCKKKAELDNYELKDSDIGYKYCSGFMETCKYAEKLAN